jgi:hypothetical protein
MNSCPTFCSSLIEESVRMAQLAGVGTAVGAGVLVGVALAVGSATGVGVTVGVVVGGLALAAGLGVDVGTGHAVPLIGGNEASGGAIAAGAGGWVQAVSNRINDRTRPRGRCMRFSPWRRRAPRRRAIARRHDG